MNEKNSSMLINVQLRERSILKNVYLWMASGLALSGLAALLVASSATMSALFLSGYTLLFIIIAEFALVFYLTSRLEKMSTGAAVLSFTLYALLNGVTLSSIFLIYNVMTISRAFFVSAALFGGASLYAITTERNLDGVGYYLGLALWGVIIASLVNLLFRSSGMDFLISLVGVALFVGLTAWDTQKIKRMNVSHGDYVDEDLYVKLSIIAALMLYLDFLNLFLYLLRLFGRREQR